ncbi:transmembrane protein -like [Brachionus plicatilis]|uniref:Transmembrane protein-like n=1 Tax=Brachionus plicatilis TaxID=10195 RepID=A0A3M7SP52_BRAPC|nr:transmembrane protein -like [Brachionus plicatilis]
MKLAESKIWSLVVILFCSILENVLSNPQIEYLGMDKRKFADSVSQSLIISIRPHKKTFSKIWSTAQLVIKSEKPCKIYEDFNLTSLSNSENKFPVLSTILSKLKSFQESSEYSCQYVFYLPMFKNYSAKIEIDGPLEVEYLFTYIDIKLVTFCLLGVLLFYTSSKLSRNEVFQYFSGMSLGIVGSLILLLIIIIRFIPRKKIATMAFLTGSSFFLYLVRWVYFNFKNLTESFQLYILLYLFTAGVISAAYCYYRGPVKNERGINIINLILKFLSMILIYLGASNNQFSISLIISFLIVNFVYKCRYFKNFALINQIKFKYFPEKRRLLTQDEFIRQGEEYTIKALNELRDFCRSPECDAWKTIRKISQPGKFSNFIEDTSYHLSDEEIIEYESYSISNDLIDDDD